MAMLVCDVCGGNLQMDAGGKTATCQFCGMQYSIERMREKIQEIRGTVKVEGSVQARQTGTTEDVEQWRILMHKYLDANDYKSAYDIIGKIMEAAPSDEECGNLYPVVRDYLDLEVVDGVLRRYTGKKSELALPEGITDIAAEAFQNDTCVTKLVLPDSVEKIGDRAFKESALKEIVFSPNSKLSCIGAGAFMNAKLNAICIPARLSELSEQAFFGCPITKIEFAECGNLMCIGITAFAKTRINDVTIPSYVKKIDDYAFLACYQLEYVFFEDANSIQSIGKGAFSMCTSLKSFPQALPNLKEAGQGILGDATAIGFGGPITSSQKSIFGGIWKKNGQCPFCGSEDIKPGILGINICSSCHMNWKK